MPKLSNSTVYPDNNRRGSGKLLINQRIPPVNRRDSYDHHSHLYEVPPTLGRKPVLGLWLGFAFGGRVIRVGIRQDLADLAGISEQTVRSLETGQGNPSLKAVIAAAHVLGFKLTVTR